MGKTSGTHSQSRSRSPRTSTQQLNQDSQELFKVQARDLQQGLQSSQNGIIPPSSSLQGSLQAQHPEASSLSNQIVNIDALRDVASDIKDTFTAAIADLKMNLQAMCTRMDAIEESTTRHEVEIQSQHKSIQAYNLQFRDMQRHLEDLDNRGRRHNLRVRGIPENIDNSILAQTTRSIFNDILGRPPDVAVEFERIHRALRPRGRESDPPRDVVCCLTNFRLKEDILRCARDRGEFRLQGSEIKIFQDLSPITLQKRRDLRPLLDLLRSRSITYKWKFPFCLSASHQGRTALLRSPDDIRSFCDTLNLPLIALPEWGNPYTPQPIRRISSMDTIPEREDLQARRRRSPSPSHLLPSTSRSTRRSSPTASPVHRKPRHEDSR